jgi:hypothetical protein
MAPPGEQLLLMLPSSVSFTTPGAAEVSSQSLDFRPDALGTFAWPSCLICWHRGIAIYPVFLPVFFRVLVIVVINFLFSDYFVVSSS